ncbi:hypothetical protein [Sulfitobacter sp. SK012]|uniref:hypothetical protein n=1 Tax=Sulfitobacter sp. SK012 TaxID=1389005 RepID=UPI0020C80F99|nr:hypothetical protein [Sulfitobacter sp. SK012]
MEPLTSTIAYNQISMPVLQLQNLGVLLFFVLPAFAVIGHLVGKSVRKKHLGAGKDIDVRAGETTMGAVFAILGLLLAFSFGNAMSLSRTAKEVLINEAATIGTAFDRADYLPEPGRSEIKLAIYAYAVTRIVPEKEEVDTSEKVRSFLDASLREQAILWPLTLKVTADPLPAPMKTFFAGSINDVLDAHLFRMQTLSEPVSNLSQFMVLGAALTAMFLMGNRSGVLGRTLTWRIFLLSGFLFVIMFTIADTNRFEEGLVQVDDGTLRATIAEIENALGVKAGS